MRSFVPLQAPIIEAANGDAYRYKEYKPSLRLSPYVAAYWTLEVQISDFEPKHRILPDGCVDLIFNLRAASASDCAFAVGVMTRPEAFHISEDFSLFGIRFYSETVRRFTRYPVSEFKDVRVFLQDLWGSDAIHLSERIITACHTQERIEQIETALLIMLNRTEDPCEVDVLLHGLQYVYAKKGMLSVRSLADQLHYSERTVRRVFQKELGVGPKEITEIIRFQCLLRELYGNGTDRFTDLAVKYGYYDQPHFIHSFKRLYGSSPLQVFKSRLHP